MASNDNVLFSIGTEDKMDMSLDAIIKQNKKTETGGKNRNPMARRNNTGNMQQRKRDLAKRVSARAAARRTGRVDNARGITPSNRVQNNTRRTNNANNNNNNTDGNWVKQQRQRKLAERLKLKAYKESRDEPAGSGPRINSAGFRFDAPSYVSNGNNNNNNNTRFDRDRRRPTIKNLTVNVRSSAPAANRSRQNTQNRQRNLVNNRRGIVSSNNNNSNNNNNYNNNSNNNNNDRRTLNDRFGSGDSSNRSGSDRVTITRGRGGRRTLTTSRNSLFSNNNRRNFNDNNNNNNNNNNNRNYNSNRNNNNRRGGRRGGLFN